MAHARSWRADHGRQRQGSCCCRARLESVRTLPPAGADGDLVGGGVSGGVFGGVSAFRSCVPTGAVLAHGLRRLDTDLQRLSFCGLLNGEEGIFGKLHFLSSCKSPPHLRRSSSRTCISSACSCAGLGLPPASLPVSLLGIRSTSRTKLNPNILLLAGEPTSSATKQAMCPSLVTFTSGVLAQSKEAVSTVGSARPSWRS